MPLGRDTVPGRDGPPGRDVAPRSYALRDGDGLREHDGLPGSRDRDIMPGRDGLPEPAASPGSYGLRDRDGLREHDPGRSSRRTSERPAAPDPLQAEERPGRGTRAAAPLPGPWASARPGPRAGNRRVKVLALAIVTVVVVAAAAAGALRLLSHGTGRAHVLVAPSRLASFVRRPQLEQQMNARALQQQVIATSAGQASHVVSAVYENTAGVSGAAPPQIFLFIGGNLAGVSPGGFISSFTAQFNGAQAASPGSLGGRAACVNARGSATGSVALCTWADGDTFGVVTSPTMGLAQLAAQMRAIRPAVERPAR